MHQTCRHAVCRGRQSAGSGTERAKKQDEDIEEASFFHEQISLMPSVRYYVKSCFLTNAFGVQKRLRFASMDKVCSGVLVSYVLFDTWTQISMQQWCVSRPYKSACLTNWPGVAETLIHETVRGSAQAGADAS